MAKQNHTGEIPILLNGRKETLKATWKSMSDIEDDLQLGVVPLAAKIQSANFGLREASTVIYHGIKASGVNAVITKEAVSEEVFRAGVLSEEIVSALTDFLEYCLTGGELPKFMADGGQKVKRKSRTAV